MPYPYKRRGTTDALHQRVRPLLPHPLFQLLNKNTFTEKVVSFPILRKRCDCGLGYSNGRDVVRKHVEVEDKTTVAICDTGYVDDEYGMKRPTPTMMG